MYNSKDVISLTHALSRGCMHTYRQHMYAKFLQAYDDVGLQPPVQLSLVQGPRYMHVHWAKCTYNYVHASAILYTWKHRMPLQTCNCIAEYTHSQYLSFVKSSSLPHLAQTLLPFGSTLEWPCTLRQQWRLASHISRSHSDTAPPLEGGHPETSGGPLGQPWQTLQT